MKKKHNFIAYISFQIFRIFVKFFYRKYWVKGKKNVPKKECIIVGNHAQMHGPLACELYLSRKHYTWCAGQMMRLKDVPEYAYQDFWSRKPEKTRWFYKGLSYVIAPLCVWIFNNARTIPVYRDGRIITTFKQTIARLEQGKRVVIFPECYDEYNHVVNEFQKNFIDIAKLYYKKTGVELYFVPMYIAPRLRRIRLGQPIQYRAQENIEAERERISSYLKEEITNMAVSLPKHKVVPYANVSKKEYPINKKEED